MADGWLDERLEAPCGRGVVEVPIERAVAPLRREEPALRLVDGSLLDAPPAGVARDDRVPITRSTTRSASRSR